MGKNRAIKSLGRIIAGMVAHKILEKYTNKKESLNHLRNEINNYRDSIYDSIEEFNWSLTDKQRIKKETLKSLKKELKEPHFNDVKFPINEAEKLTEETLNEIT